MVKKLGLTSLFTRSNKVPWQWPSCNQPRTTSFRDISPNYNLDSADSYFSNSSTLTSSASSSDSSDPSDVAESVIHAVKSDRLFFEPGSTSSIVDQEDTTKKQSDVNGFESSAIAMELESEDPYKDFRNSMEEMVMANGVKDLDWLEEMLGWYLMVNPKSFHGVILGAFVDLLVGLACNNECCNCN